MNSNRSYKMVWLVGVAVLASCFGAGLARAQEFAGKFTLPFDARWGQAILPAGDYSFRLDKAQSAGTVRLFQGNKGVGLIHAQAYDKKTGGPDALMVVRGKTVNTVRELRLPEIGIVLIYSPGPAKPMTAEEERQIAKAVPVTKTGN